MRRKLAYVTTALVVCVSAIALAQDGDDQQLPFWIMKKLGVEFDLRSMGRVLADQTLTDGGMALPSEATPVPGLLTVPQVQLRGGNTRVNDPALDYTQVFAGFRPFIHFTQSETSLAVSGRNIVATYNTSAGLHLIPAPPPAPPGSLVVDRVKLSGFSVSQDGGQTWASGFLPGVTPAGPTFGDPSVDSDRFGNFYFSGLGADAAGDSAIVVNKSTDGGLTWSPAVVVQQDNGRDKEWIAVGPDPVVKHRDDVYVTWTSFQSTGAQLRFGRSTDGGETFTAKTIFAPSTDPVPSHPQNFLQFSNPVVDRFTGRLYIPFIQFSETDQDFIRILISDDGGGTFHFATFNAPGSLLPTLLPVTQAGELTDCGATIVRPPGRPPFISLNTRLTIHAGAPTTLGQAPGVPFRRFVNAARLVTQPAIAARNGVVYLAWSNSTSLVFGDPHAGSNIWFVRSDDGGDNWSTPVQVNPIVSGDIHHVLPALAIDEDPNDVHVLYYTQHTNGTIDVDLANSHDRGDTFPADRTVRATSTAFSLAPTNIPVPSASQPYATTNYDRQIAQCYSLGEYVSVATANGSVYALWGDERNNVTHPINSLDPLSGQTHSQQDVVFQKVKAQ